MEVIYKAIGKSYALTIGKTYEAVETNGFYHLINDNGKEARYGTALFVVSQEPEPEPTSIERLILEVKNIRYAGDRIVYQDRGASRCLEVSSFPSSCGIKCIDGINGFASTSEWIVSVICEKFAIDDLTDEELAPVWGGIFKKLVKSSLRNRVDDLITGALIFSTNYEYEWCIPLMDEMLGEGHDYYNPNEGHDLRIWNFDLRFDSVEDPYGDDDYGSRDHSAVRKWTDNGYKLKFKDDVQTGDNETGGE